MQKTTRRQVFGDEEHGTFRPDAEIQSSLTSLLAAQFGDSLPVASSLDRLSSHTSPTGTGKESQLLRLVSGSAPVDIVCEKGLVGPSIPRIRPIEDTDSEALERHKRSIQSAFHPLKDSAPVIHTAITIPVYTSKESFDASTHTILALTSSSNLSRHSSRRLSIIHACEVPSAEPKRRRHKRKRHRTLPALAARTLPHPIPTRPQPQFFVPPPHLGGKSQGYAMGWRPFGQPGGPKYVRLKMSRGAEIASDRSG
ncbi:hypothetical protein DL93DRAFT_2082875 [Clavulina sp. PMI_390]|nr:hypothetical protein DL93DRAFT_2082875 [Clavulina sp. PMI_390]